MLLFRAPKTTKRVDKQKKKGIAEKPNVKRKNALGRKLEGVVTNTMMERVIETDHDRALPSTEGTLTKETVIAGADHLPEVASSASVG